MLLPLYEDQRSTLKKQAICSEIYFNGLERDIILSILVKEEGFIENFEEIEEGSRLYVLVSLKYKGKNRYPVLTALKRVSKPGLRVYANHKELPRVLGGLGIAVISTSQGIMTDRSARHNGLGGEVLCYIW